MKKYFGVMVPMFASAAVLTLAVACANDKASDSVNARRGQPCDNKTKMCQGAGEEIYGKLGADTYLNDLLKELDEVKDVNQKNANKKAAKEIRNIVLLIEGKNASVTVTDNSSTPHETILTGELKDGKADLAAQDSAVTAKLQCLDSADKCAVSRIDLSKKASVQTMVASGKVGQNQSIKAEIKTLEKTGMVNVKAILRTTKADMTAEVDPDLANKSDAYKKIHDLFTAKAAGRQDQNTIKDIRVQSSEIANGKSFISAVILSNEKEVIGIEGKLHIIGKNTEGKTSVEMIRNVNSSVLKAMKVDGDIKKTIMESLKSVALTAIEAGNKLTLKLTVLGKDGKTLESLLAKLTLSEVATPKEGATPVDADKKVLDAQAYAETEAVSNALIYEESQEVIKKVPTPEDLKKTVR